MINARAEIGRHHELVQAGVPQATLHRPRRRVLRVEGRWTDEPARSRRPPNACVACDRRDGEPLAFAGLWEIWRNPEVDDATRPTRGCARARSSPPAPTTCSRRSTIACRWCSPEDEWDRWLDPANDDVATLESLLAPAPDDWFETYEVSMRVNKPENNDAALLDPVGAVDAAGSE